ncbi:hypothetical protein JX266_009290 [Neoarthrinium moseri]|nr:hypothetical protein JX266_009290 [Neoarthrinium moseri]
MSGPRTKRQFAGAASDPAQRRITSFFAGAGAPSPSLSTSDHRIAAESHAFSSTDNAVQANLLSVGMRVRKAVPEGYKTGTYSAFALWDENNRDTTPTGATHDAARSRSYAVSTPRELLPFCGINKVGGLGTQDTFASQGPGLEASSISLPSELFDADGMDDVPGLTLSQESTDSNDSTASGITGANTRKRFFVDDDEGTDISGRLNVTSWQDWEVSPRSLAPTGWANDRVLAVPRKGRLRGKLGGASGNVALGQENVMVTDEDFEEAAFLDPNLEVEMDDVV